MSALSLLFSRRFGALFACITLGAFNDNYFKNALIILLTYKLAKMMGVDIVRLLAIAQAFFILPFFLCSAIAGEFADAMPKHRLARILKVTELVLMIAAAGALMLNHAWTLFIILFLVAVQAAFFGPMKYAILPQLLRREELMLGNGLVESGTFLCILLGTIAGTALILRPHGEIIVAAMLVALGIFGVIAAWYIPQTDSGHKREVRINYNILQSTWRMLRHAMSNNDLRVPILGISWFWAIGATYLLQLPVFTKEVLGGNQNVVALFNGVFAMGVALGSLLCSYIVEHLHARHLSRLALSGVCLFGLDVCWAGYHAAAPTPDELVGMMAYVTGSFNHIRIALDLFLMAFCGGMFSVPLYTRLQLQSAEQERARTIASNNVMNALFIAVAAGITYTLFAQKFSVLQVLLLFALLNIPVILLLRRMQHGAQ